MSVLQRMPSAARLGSWLLSEGLPPVRVLGVALISGPLPTSFLTNLTYFGVVSCALNGAQVPRAIEWRGGGVSQLGPTFFGNCL